MTLTQSAYINSTAAGENSRVLRQQSPQLLTNSFIVNILFKTLVVFGSLIFKRLDYIFKACLVVNQAKIRYIQQLWLIH